jgi:hypothetical protein
VSCGETSDAGLRGVSADDDSLETMLTTRPKTMGGSTDGISLASGCVLHYC